MDKAIIDQHLNKYNVFTIDKKELVSRLNNRDSGQFQLRINERLDWTIDLVINDLRAPDYRQTYVSDQGEFEIEQFNLNQKCVCDRMAKYKSD